MNITLPPVLIPLGLIVLAYVLCKYWFPAHIRLIQRNTSLSRRQMLLELVIVFLVAGAILVALALVSGYGAVFVKIAHGLIWCLQGLLWDCTHPFAYGFSFSL